MGEARREQGGFGDKIHKIGRHVWGAEVFYTQDH